MVDPLNEVLSFLPANISYDDSSDGQICFYCMSGSYKRYVVYSNFEFVESVSAITAEGLALKIIDLVSINQFKWKARSSSAFVLDVPWLGGVHSFVELNSAGTWRARLYDGDKREDIVEGADRRYYCSHGPSTMYSESSEAIRAVEDKLVERYGLGDDIRSE